MPYLKLWQKIGEDAIKKVKQRWEEDDSDFCPDEKFIEDAQGIDFDWDIQTKECDDQSLRLKIDIDLVSGKHGCPERQVREAWDRIQKLAWIGLNYKNGQ